MKTLMKMLVVLWLLSGLLGCMTSSAHDTTRKFSIGTSLEYRTTTSQGPDIVAWDRVDILARETELSDGG